jgi:hypothetical protein
MKKDGMERGRDVRGRIPGTPIFCSVGEENCLCGVGRKSSFLCLYIACIFRDVYCD